MKSWRPLFAAASAASNVSNFCLSAQLLLKPRILDRGLAIAAVDGSGACRTLGLVVLLVDAPAALPGFLEALGLRASGELMRHVAVDLPIREVAIQMQAVAANDHAL